MSRFDLRRTAIIASSCGISRSSRSQRQGVDWQTFSEIGYFAFGFATKELAERKFYTNPQEPNRAHVGFVPVAFNADLAQMP
jgi:hypothetical protein